MRIGFGIEAPWAGWGLSGETPMAAAGGRARLGDAQWLFPGARSGRVEIRRVSILLISITLHLCAWLVYQHRPPAITQPRLLNSMEVALVTPLPAPKPAPPSPVVPEPRQEARPLPPDPKPQPKLAPKKPKPKPAVAKEARTETLQETTAAASPPPSVAPAAPAQPASDPYIEASYNAAYLRNPPPSYPAVARERHWEGTVVLRVEVTAEGHPGQVNIDRSSGHEILDEAATEAARQWRFVPAKRGETALSSWVLIPIEFKLRR